MSNMLKRTQPLFQPPEARYTKPQIEVNQDFFQELHEFHFDRASMGKRKISTINLFTAEKNKPKP